MNNLKTGGQTTKLIITAVIGLILIGVYFFLVMSSPLTELLRPGATREKILSSAQSFFQKLPVIHSQFERGISIGKDQTLLDYAQYYKKEHGGYPRLVPGYYTVTWVMKQDGSSRSGASEHRDPLRGRRYFQIKYDFSGNLMGFWDNTRGPGLMDVIGEISEEDALFEAKYFLGEFGIKTESLNAVKREISKKGNNIQHKFVLGSGSQQYPGLQDQYTVELLGTRVISYQLARVIDSKTVKIQRSRRHDDDSEAGFAVPITWAIILLILIVRFIKKIRKDQLEFKRALWLGIVAALLVFIAVAVNAWEGGWPAVLIGGGFGALFIFLGMMLVYPAAESQVRSVRPKKLAVIDLLFQGKFLIRETGEAVLRSFFLVGLTLSAFGILFYVVPTLNIASISIGPEMLNMFQNPVNGMTIIIKNILFTVLGGLAFLCFWPWFLREKIKNTTLLLFLSALSFGLVGMQFIFINPRYLGFLLFFPIVFGWAYIVYKYDLLTVLFSVFGVLMLLDMIFVLVMPGSLYSIPGTAAIGSTVIFFLLGIYLVFHPRSAEDYADYVPEYVSRLAEQERLLKELEIARNVQMRFLPQKVPEFPNLEIVSLCQPAMEVGGDYYDFVRMDETCMSVLIGDVSGKGVSAAFYMTMVKGIIKTLSKKTRQPAVLLAEANEIFCENAPRDVFITVIYGIFDQSAQTLTLASAGHNPLIAWKKKTNTIQLFNPRGIALGLEQGKRYREIIEETVIPVEEGDIFVFYTDGVSESMNMKSEIFGEGRLKEIIESSAHLSPRLIQKNIVEAVSRFSGQAPQHDDFTMVVVKVKPRGTGGLL